tara:strand:- start:452 stop:676 length:225 start_codon:yes stop_codon:yes gene_type:complete
MSKDYWGKAYIINQILELKNYENINDPVHDEEKQKLAELTIVKLNELRQDLKIFKKQNQNESLLSRVGGCPDLY